MKKLAIVLVLLLSTSVFAQGLAFGVKGGINYATLSGDDVVDAEWKLGFAAGAVAAFDVMDMLVIQGEVLYSMKGAGYEGDISTDLTYIEIPVLLKYSIPMAGMIAPNLFIGPSLGILLSAESNDVDVKENTKSMDYGLVFGAGVDFDLGTGKVTVDARYNYGLTSIDDTAAELDVKNGGISVMVGYLFGI
ncbi:PorT family protein [candidate division WOR-3 bacterium]|jgi:opacity protein-like surface antigen|nr:PorT family protein [candidate division WOR-3 bacterium]